MCTYYIHRSHDCIISATNKKLAEESIEDLEKATRAYSAAQYRAKRVATHNVLFNALSQYLYERMQDDECRMFRSHPRLVHSFVTQELSTFRVDQTRFKHLLGESDVDGKYRETDPSSLKRTIRTGAKVYVKFICDKLGF